MAERNRHTRDFTLNNLRDAIRSLVASLQVYRTYIDPATESVSERDRRYIEDAVRRAEALTPYVDPSVFAFLADTLLLRNHGQFGTDDRQALAHWVMKFQQITGPVMAKGVEDTAFYRYNRLIALNEVGGHPSLFGIDVPQFHKDNERRANRWPHSLLATSTHDNKRSEDVRARLAVLSELPGEWEDALHEWSALNLPHKASSEGPNGVSAAAASAVAGGAPDRNDEYLLYQTLLGAWPLGPAGSSWGGLLPPGAHGEYGAFVERVREYMNKAVKEAKVHGSWVNPDAGYDRAVASFVDAVLQPGPGNRFLDAFGPFAARMAALGQVNSLAQVALKLTSPGVPDLYQGNELWDFSLVDPDNRRPVDYGLRQRLLAGLPGPGAVSSDALDELLAHSDDGRIKLFVTARLLALRRAEPELFAESDYAPLAAAGAAAEHVVAFGRETNAEGRGSRGRGSRRIVVVVPRLPARLLMDGQRWPLGEAVWGDTHVRLPAGWPPGARLTDVLTGRTVAPEGDGLRLADALGALPVAVLVAE